jgi:hypothetical protein
MIRPLCRDVMRTLAVIALFTAAEVVAQEQPASTWNFAVSGDSRNCGDVVVPAIAAGAKTSNAIFYWHLGDFRAISDIDEDMQCGPNHLAGTNGLIKYGITAWKDFLDNQVASFGATTVYLGIGNHDTIFRKDRGEFLRQFSGWLDSPVLQRQRLKDDPEDRCPHTYYHWIDRGIDFINLDNATSDQFNDAQMKWFRGVVARDLADANVKTLVLGMHKALPDSIALSHSMNDSPMGTETGREVYRILLDAQGKGKHVYILASHSHYYADNIYDTEYWRSQGGVVPGWIVGTAGAHRYALPDSVQPAQHAQTNVYGYLLATAHSGGAQDGTIDFTFVQVHLDGVPADVAARFDPGFVSWCFSSNSDSDKQKPQCKKPDGQ